MSLYTDRALRSFKGHHMRAVIFYDSIEKTKSLYCILGNRLVAVADILI